MSRIKQKHWLFSKSFLISKDYYLKHRRLGWERSDSDFDKMSEIFQQSKHSALTYWRHGECSFLCKLPRNHVEFAFHSFWIYFNYVFFSAWTIPQLGERLTHSILVCILFLTLILEKNVMNTLPYWFRHLQIHTRLKTSHRNIENNRGPIRLYHTNFKSQYSPSPN